MTNICHESCITFGKKVLSKDDIKEKKILDVGSFDVNGSLRPYIMTLGPLSYIGIDMEKGHGVDMVCSANDILEKFGNESFDVVISTELLEHVKDWANVISNIKNICKRDGIILITTRSYGFQFHPYPNDFWRFELEDMMHIFSDCHILNLEKDSQAAGVFIKIKKPDNFIEKNLSGYKLYNMSHHGRV